eukprot:scaffold34595_cov160-Amphora_coffeaeformis.AAC.5
MVIIREERDARTCSMQLPAAGSLLSLATAPRSARCRRGGSSSELHYSNTTEIKGQPRASGISLAE